MNTQSAPRATAITVRRLRPSDSLAELTALLHRAYKPQMDMGLKPLAGRQTVDVTRERTASGECFVAVSPALNGAPEKIVGTILFQEIETAAFPPHFLKPGVVHFSLLAVDPDIQGKGIGQALLDHVERRAASLGASEIALSMAEPDTNLLNYYLRRGYRHIEYWQWPYTNYKSAILSKPIN